MKNKIVLFLVLLSTILLTINLTGCNNDKKSYEEKSSTKDEVCTEVTTAVPTEQETISCATIPAEKTTEKPTVKPTEKPTQTPTEKVTENPVVQNNISVNTNNILFIGNSLVEGIRLCNQTNHDFLSITGISLDGLKSNIYNQIPNYSCNTVIIGMGTNELGSYSESQFKNSYKDLINKIYSVNKNSKIICMSIPPITNSRSSYDTLFNNTNVQKYNKYIEEICNETNTIYLDNTPFFGYTLNEEWSGDGIHLIGYVYIDWYDFIISQIS